MSKWKPVTSIPQGTMLGQIVLNILIDTVICLVGCTLIQFAYNIRMDGEVDKIVGKDALQRSLDKLGKYIPTRT